MGVFSAWAVAIGLQVYRDTKAGRVPLPSEFVASGAVFGLFAGVTGAAPSSAGFMGALSWGFLAALFLQVGPAALVATTNPVAPGTTQGAQGKSGLGGKGRSGQGAGGGGGGSF